MASSKCSYLPANSIRQVFLDYFANNGHTLIRPSSVKPFGDPTLEFVNAGMNQFKNVFLGLENIPFERAANSQKCIRVGGKHNDLSVVGLDGYHHTFFEMLGNWSFNNYFKEEACRLAWNLVTAKPFALHPKRLYVTYFGGDKDSNLEPDLETKEIWLSLGIDKERVLPFGLNDNFWEMGPTGPCGPCTEIHYDHLSETPRPHVVNAGFQDLTELWNIVFIQFNRLQNDKLEKLDKHFVDTGMGLERLVALLQKKDSNYDTDLFSAYFSTISKLTGLREYKGRFGELDNDGLDTTYRILADHCRMITIAVADNIFPRYSHGLRRVIRRALITSDDLSPGKGVTILSELCNVAAHSLSNVFPETISSLNQVKYIIEEEYEIWKNTKSRVEGEWVKVLSQHPQLEYLSDSRSIGLISAIDHLSKLKGSVISRDLALTLYDRHGLTPNLLYDVASSLGYKMDIESLEKDIVELKKINKSLIHSKTDSQFNKIIDELVMNKVCNTDDSQKLNYCKNEKNNYELKKLKCRLQAILLNGMWLKDDESLEDGDKLMVILNKTNMWPETEQSTEADAGLLCFAQTQASINIEKAINVGEFVLHYGTFSSPERVQCSKLKQSDCELSVDGERRLALMRNTTTAHLIHLALSRNYVNVIHAIDITPRKCSITFSIFGHSFTMKDADALEKEIEQICAQKINITQSVKSSNELVGLSDIFIPPFINVSATQQIHVVSLNTNPLVRSVTFGPNVYNTSEIQNISILNVDLKNKNREVSLEVVTGSDAIAAKENGHHLLQMINNTDQLDEETFNNARQFIKKNLIPWSMKEQFVNKYMAHTANLNSKKLRGKIDLLTTEIKKVEETDGKYFISYCGKGTKLEKFERLPAKIPVLLYAVNNGYLNARCSVLQDSFLSAEEWMKKISEELGTHAVPSKKHGKNVFYMSPLRVPKSEAVSFLDKFKAIAHAKAQLLIDNKCHTN